MKTVLANQKGVVSLLMMLLLIVGLQGVSDADKDPIVEQQRLLLMDELRGVSDADEALIVQQLPPSQEQLSPSIYWTNPARDKIQRANLDGSNVIDLITRLPGPWDIALDVAGGKMYWVDAGTYKIQRANLDGSNVEDLVTSGLSRPGSIALDVAGRKMYWADFGTYRIQRANLDGSNVENLVTSGLVTPGSIALDVAGRKMYWTDEGTDRIQRANLDGSNVENLVTGVLGPLGITLDVAGGKMYWTDWLGEKIQRANLDGSTVEDLVRGLDSPWDIALDVAGGKMYWTHMDYSLVSRQFSNGKIQRANLNGTAVENLVTGLDTRSVLTGITLGIPLSSPITFRPSTIADQTFTVGTQIQPLRLPVAAGGTAPYTYNLDPILAGLSFNPATRLLSGTPTTAATATPITYTATDATGASATLNFNIEVIGDGKVPGPGPVDVNADGQVTVIDLAIVALFYGTQVPDGVSLPADVNSDGTVDILDLTAVAQGIDAAGNAGTLAADDVEGALEGIAEQINALEGVAGAPAHFSTSQHALLSGIAYRNVAAAFADAKHLATDDARLGKWMPMLKELLHRLAEMREIPDTMALLPNYPNPFNPETWIPYHLSKGTEVTLTIYDISGNAVRALTLGHQSAGVYESRARAAYWDGKNQLGEQVASGVYFYTLTAGEFTATRKLLIVK